MQNRVQTKRAGTRERKTRYPELDFLRESFGISKAWIVADLVAEMRDKGRDTVAASMKKSTWYRLKRELKEIGIELPA